MVTFDELHGGHPDQARPLVGDGRVDVLGQARLIEGRAVGELFLDTADGATVVVVLRQGADGAARVEIHNRNDYALDVVVGDEVVYTAPTF